MELSCQSAVRGEAVCVRRILCLTRCFVYVLRSAAPASFCCAIEHAAAASLVWSRRKESCSERRNSHAHAFLLSSPTPCGCLRLRLPIGWLVYTFRTFSKRAPSVGRTVSPLQHCKTPFPSRFSTIGHELQLCMHGKKLHDSPQLKHHSLPWIICCSNLASTLHQPNAFTQKCFDLNFLTTILDGCRTKGQLSN